MEAERAEVWRELEELREEAEGLHDESSEDSESSGLWRTASECEGNAADEATIIDYSKTGANKR